MRIDFLYDTLCPWCLVGKRQMDLAMAAERPRDLTVVYRPFMLYPHFEKSGHEFLAFFREKYGETLRVPMWDRIRAIAAPLGIDFAFERITRGPASIDSHRLVRHVGRVAPGREGDAIEAIMRGFFEEAHIVDHDFLVGVAARLGADPGQARAYLESDRDEADIFAETDAWRAQGVRSMPTYIVDGHTVLAGADLDTFRRLFRGETMSAA